MALKNKSITMKKILKLIKTYFGEMITVIGSGILIYNILSFSFRAPESGIAYYYKEDALVNISIGTMLIVGGILIIRGTKDTMSSGAGQKYELDKTKLD